MNCIHHPGKKSVIMLYQHNYCQACKDGIFAVRVKVRRHCEPRECFIWYEKANTWSTIIGTGCAHYVAHQLGIFGTFTKNVCFAGYLFKVPDIVKVTTLVDIKDLQLNDIYINPSVNHTGLVIKIDNSKITIRHASSGQEKVAENEFATYFKGKGTFRRYIKK